MDYLQQHDVEPCDDFESWRGARDFCFWCGWRKGLHSEFLDANQLALLQTSTLGLISTRQAVGWGSVYRCDDCGREFTYWSETKGHDCGCIPLEVMG